MRNESVDDLFSGVPSSGDQGKSYICLHYLKYADMMHIRSAMKTFVNGVKINKVSY